MLKILLYANGESYVYGDLKTLYPTATFSELNDIRLSNWTIFKNRCDSVKNNTGTVNLKGERLEFWVPVSDSVLMSSGTDLTISGMGSAATKIYCYPLAPIKGEAPLLFNQQFQSSLKFKNLTITREDIKKYETYSCVLKKSGNTKLVEVLGTVRPEFWTNLQVGATFYYAWQISVIGEANTVASWDSTAKTITLTNNISASVTNNMSGAYVNCGVYFEQDISLVNYQLFGKPWAVAEGFEYCKLLQTWVAQTDAILTLEGVEFSGGETLINYSGAAIKMYMTDTYFTNCEIGVDFYSASIGNNQQWHIDNVTFERCGYVIAGGIAVGTSQNLLGSGAYIHPNIAVKKIGTGRLNLLDNYAAAFRQYSASGPKPIAIGSTTEFGVVTCTNNAEYDLMVSNSMPVTVDEYNTDSAGLLLVGNNFTLSKGIVNRMSMTTSSEPVVGAYTVNFVDCRINGAQSFNWIGGANALSTVNYINCVFVSGVQTTYQNVLDGDHTYSVLKELNIVGGSYILGPTGGLPWAVGGAIATYINATRLIRITGFRKIRISNFTTEKIYGGLFQTDTAGAVPTYIDHQDFLITDSDIQTWEFVTRAATEGTYSFHFPVVHSNVLGLVGNTSQLFTPVIHKKSTTVASNTINATLDSNEYDISGGGTVKMVKTYYVSRSSVITEGYQTNVLGGPIIINAIGTNIVFQKFDAVTNQNSNVRNDYTCLAGQSCLVTPDQLDFTATASPVSTPVIVGTGNGTKKIWQGYFNSDPNPKSNVTLVCGAITGTANSQGVITGVGIVQGQVDYWGLGFYIEFAVAPPAGTDVVITYDKATGFKYAGTVTISAYP